MDIDVWELLDLVNNVCIIIFLKFIELGLIYMCYWLGVELKW